MQAALQLLEFLQLPSPRREGPVADRPRCKARGFSIRVRRGAGLRGSSGLRVRGWGAGGGGGGGGGGAVPPPPRPPLASAYSGGAPPPPASPLFTEGRSYPLACEVEDTAPRSEVEDTAPRSVSAGLTQRDITKNAPQLLMYGPKKLYKRDITKNAHTPRSYTSETSQKMRTRQAAMQARHHKKCAHAKRRARTPLCARARTHTHTHTHTHRPSSWSQAMRRRTTGVQHIAVTVNALL